MTAKVPKVKMRVPVEDLPIVAEVWGIPYHEVLRAWSLVYVWREMLTARGPLPILPWEPLERVRCRRMRMLTLAQAERYCARVGMHPRHVWGDWYTALCAVLHPVNVAEVLADDVARAIGGCELVAAWLAVRSLGAWRQFASGAAA